MPSHPIYRDSDRIAAITDRSDNIKTGDMEQLYILARHQLPHKAVQAGNDVLVCGDCPLRSKASGGSSACFVVTVQGPRSVWNSIRGKRTKKPTPSAKPIRLGAYGDPAFLPIKLIANLVNGRKWTGYTHQWHRRSKRWSQYLMASIDSQMAKRQGLTSLGLKRKAQAKGYRTFRIVQDETELDTDEIMCPNYSKGVQCADCGLCNGSTTGDKRKNIAIIVHGSSKGSL